MSLFTSKIVMPEALNESINSFFEEWVLLWLGEPEQRWDGPVEYLPWWWMVQLLQLLQPPESCCFPLCCVWLNGKIKTKNLKTLKNKIQFVEGRSLKWRPILRSCASLSISTLRVKTRTNDKQPSQSLIYDSHLRLFPLLKADRPNTIYKQNYIWKRAPKGKCFLHSNCVYIHTLMLLLQILVTEWLNMIINQHRDFSSPYASQFYKFDIPSFKFQAGAWAGTNANKISSIKQHTIGLLDQTAKYESVFVNSWGTSLQIVWLKAFIESLISRPNTVF